MKRVLKAISVVLALAMLLSLCAFASETDYKKKLDEALSLYENNSLFADGKTDYVREALVEMFGERPELFYELMNKIYSRDDRYSKFMTPERYDQSYNQSNSLVGIGVTITMGEDGYLVVQSLMDGPANAAGLRQGDKLVYIDDINVKGFLPTEASAFIRGKEGTSVKVSVLRGEEKLDFNIKRASVKMSDVSSYYIDDKIGYIGLSYFNGISSFIDFMEAYDEFEEKGVNTIVLDLRDNPGGALDCLINIMDNVIPQKEVPYLLTWQTKPFKVNVFYSEGYGWEFNKFVILVNGRTASAAEVMAGAMKDLGYAVLVGEKTYGKGMGQRHIETSDGDEAIVTAMELKLPVMGSYDGKGIMPDYQESLSIRRYKLPYLTPLKDKTFASKIKTDNVKAIEERLKCLGYFSGDADNVWDDATVRAINLFCRARSLPLITTRCEWEMIEKIDSEAKSLESKFTVEDRQLERAIAIAKEYSKKDEKAHCVDESKINFNGK